MAFNKRYNFAAYSGKLQKTHNHVKLLVNYHFMQDFQTLKVRRYIEDPHHG